MIFKIQTAHHQASDCGRYMISMANVGEQIVYTLTTGGKIIAQERCRNSVLDRKDALQAVQDAAREHAA
jgi:hypothetical protein